MAAVETAGRWTDLIDGVGLEIAEVFDQGQEEYTPGLDRVIKLVRGTGGKQNVTGKTGIGRLGRFDDGDDLPGGNRFKTYTTEITYSSYGVFVDVTKRSIEDRTFAAELDEMKDLSMGANFSQDESAMQIFAGGSADSGSAIDRKGYRITGYGDGEELFSTVHPTTVPGASTQSNASAAGLVLNHDNLETGHVNLLQQRTDDGLPMALLGKPELLVAPSLKKEGLEETESQLDPETGNNAINVYINGMGTDLAVSTHLANVNTSVAYSDTQWQLIVPGKAKIEHIVRQDPTLEKDVNIKNKVVTFTVDARWADAIKDWRRTYGSRGDGAAYSS